MKQVLQVARLHAINAPTTMVIPWATLALVLGINVAIFGAGAGVIEPASRTTGGLLAIYLVVGVGHLQTMTQLFPFAMGLSVTRRTFYLATGLWVLAQSLSYGLVLLVLGAVEAATNGWGIQLQFFRLGFLAQDGVLAQYLVYVGPLLVAAAAGVFTGVVFKRWGQLGIYGMAIGTVLLAGAATVLVTWQRWWPAVGSFFTEQSTFVLLAGYPLLVAVVLGAGGWFAVRRATP